MAQTTILAAGTTEATSADIVIAAGATTTVGIFGAAGALLPGGTRLAVMQATPGADNVVKYLDGAERATVLSGPGTFRVKRPPLTGDAFGVFSES
jgi:hypothetical protein